MFRISLLALFFSTPVTLFIHLFGIRMGILNKSQPQRGAILSVLVSVALLFYGISTGFPEWVTSPSSSLFLLAQLFLSTHLYFQVFNLSETARRIRILLEIKMGIIPQIDSTISTEQKIQKRVERLVELGQVKHYENKYLPVKSWLLLIALTFRKFERTLYPERF